MSATSRPESPRQGIISPPKELLRKDLRNLITPQPFEVKKQVLDILSRPSEIASGRGQVVIIHSQSMFSGKTTALCMVANEVGHQGVLAFQPKAALRPNEPGFENQPNAIISRDGIELPAQTVEDNSLMSIVERIKDERISPQEKPVIFIDEIMLFLAQAKPEKHQEAVLALKQLQEMGFHVVVDGIDRTFQQEPFTFMFSLLKEVRNNNDIHQIEMSTLCLYCDEVARGTALWLTDGKTKEKRLAPYNYNWDHPGSSDFAPVCCEEHQSCVDQPTDFVNKELPVA